MKIKLFVIGVCVAVIPFLGFTKKINSVQYGEFCQGFEDGFCEGYQDVKGGNALCPLAPLCPMPTIYQDADSYRDGYNEGFKTGMRKGYSRY